MVDYARIYICGQTFLIITIERKKGGEVYMRADIFCDDKQKQKPIEKALKNGGGEEHI